MLVLRALEIIGEAILRTLSRSNSKARFLMYDSTNIIGTARDKLIHA